MIDIKPPEEGKETNDYMISPILDDRWRGASQHVRNVLYDNKDLSHEDYVTIPMELLINISYLLEEGREYAYMAHHYAKPMEEISKTLKEILREMRKRKV